MLVDMMIDRRMLLAGMAASAAPSPLAAQEPLPLWRAAARAGLMFGAAGGPEVIRDKLLAALHRRHSRLFVHENAMKMNAIRHNEAIADYTQAEACLAFAESNGMLSQGTALVWNDDIPPWVAGKSAAELARILDGHLEELCSRFYGRFHSYGIVNEPIYPPHKKPNGYREGPFYAALGEDYVFRAFKRAAAVDPSTRLFLNEAWCEHDNALGIAVRKHLLTLIDKILDRGLKLDAVGLEAHLDSGAPWDGEAYARFLEELSRRKLRIWVSEFDVDDQHYPAEAALRDTRIAGLAADFMAVTLANRDVELFITWGLCDKSSFLREPGVARRRVRNFPARPLPFDDNGQEKRLTRAMRAAFLAAPIRP